MDRYGIEFLGAVVEVLWDQRSFEHAGTIVYYQSRHYLTGGTRGLHRRSAQSQVTPSPEALLQMVLSRRMLRHGSRAPEAKSRILVIF
jgi:hypothetical protein